MGNRFGLLILNMMQMNFWYCMLLTLLVGSLWRVFVDDQDMNME